MIPGIKLMTPHPMYDPDGTLWNIAMAMGPTKDGISTSGWRYVVYKVSYLTYMKHMSRHLPTCLQDWFSRCPLQTLLSQRLTRGSTWKSSLKWLQQEPKGYPTFTGETFLLFNKCNQLNFFSRSFFMTENYLIFTEQPWVIGDFAKVLVKHIIQVLDFPCD